MRHISKIFLFASAVAGFFASCNNDDIVPDTPTMGYRLTFDGGVGIEQTTRAHWSDERGSGNLIFNWDYTKVGVEPDEMVMGIFDGMEYLASTEGNYSTYAYIKQHGGKPDDAHWAMFETVQTYESEMPSGAYDGYQIIAVSPMLEEYNSSTLTSTAGQFVAEMPMIAAFVQVYDSSPDFLRDYMYMYASGRIEDGNATLAFKHIPATLRFIITYKRPQEAIINTIGVATSDHEAVASKKATITMDASTEEIVPVFSEDCHLDIMTLIAAELTSGETYTAYALALPLADNTAFQGKQLLFSINANDPDNEYLAFTLDAEKLANANPNGEYNWVSGKSYTIRMSLDDVLTVDDISVDDWTDGGTIDGGEAIEWVNGFSTETDEYEPATLNAEGNYEIGNAGNLFWFAEQVNAGNANYNAILTADIDLEDREWTPIGTSTTPYRGIFDGQGHVITGFSQHIEVCGNWGMFGCLNLATVENFTISGNVESNLTEKNDEFNYGVIGAANFGTVSDIHSSVNFTSDDTFMKNTVGGIVGKANQYCSGLRIERCSFSGTLDMGSADVDCLGGIVGYIYAGELVTVTDCAFYGEVKSTYTGMDQMGGILGYYRGCLLFLQNCLSIGTFGITDYTLCGAIVGVLRQHSDANVMVTDNYYMSGNAFGNSTEGDDITDGYGNQTITGSATIVNEIELENGIVASNLGEDWEQGEFYPILKK